MDFWSNVKWFFNELIKILSAEKSFFSKKRMESALAFVTALLGGWIWFWYHIKNMPVSDFLIWVSVYLAVSGYLVSQIQKEKKTNKDEENNG